MSRRTFGATWWGRAWIDALEHRARLDPNRLPRGRTYARQDRSSTLAAAAGVIEARVQGSRRQPYHVRVRVRTFSDAEWDRAIDAIAARAAHAAALLDGELAPEIVDDLAAAGVELLPGPGELGFECSCPDWASPCKHAAAVCYLAADHLDADPFALLLLRGRTRELVMAAIRRRRAPVAGSTATPAVAAVRTIPARAAAARALGALPPSPRASAEPGNPPVPAIEPPPNDAGVTAAGVLALANDAARRAHGLLASGAAGDGPLDVVTDLARLAAAALNDAAGGPSTIALLARRSGRPGPELTRLGLAWRHAGRAGVAVLADRWPAGAERLAPALEVLGPGARPRANTVVAGHLQLRLGRDGRWYRLERRGSGWDLVEPPADDPADLIGGDDTSPVPGEG